MIKNDEKGSNGGVETMKPQPNVQEKKGSEAHTQSQNQSNVVQGVVQGMVQGAVQEKNADKDIIAAKELLAKKDVELQDHINHMKRLQADFENYMKRADKEKKDISVQTKHKIMGRFLITLDDFERAFDQLKHGCNADDFIKGMTLVQTHFVKLLHEEGLRDIVAVGQKLDPFKHEVLLQKEPAKGTAQTVQEGTILEELQKGYTLDGQVLRCAKVVVAKKTISHENQNKENIKSKAE